MRLGRWWEFSILVIWLVGCQSSTVVTPGVPTPTPAPSPTPLFGLESRTPVTTLQFPTDNQAATGYQLTRVFSSVTFTLPLLLTHPPDGSDDLFVVQKNGQIRVFQNSASPTASEFLNLAAGGFAEDPYLTTIQDQGLLGLAFDPDYATNRYFYVYYNYYNAAGPAPIHRSLLVRYQRLAGQNKADASTKQIILQIAEPDATNIHYGGSLQFAPDGTLYISSGDGGPQGDPDQAAQNKALLRGKILRIRPEASAPYYSIPTDNPYASDVSSVECGKDVASQPTNTLKCKEIWALGLRNPWQTSIDAVSGKLWIGDVGWNTREEVDRISIADGNASTGGKNLGWRKYEGNLLIFPGDAFPLDQDVTPPLIDYPRVSTGVLSGASVTGGIVYRGASLPQLQGQYVFGDYGVGKVFRLVTTTNPPVPYLVGTQGGVVSFGEDKDHELYSVSIGGEIYKITEGSIADPGSFPSQLSATGLFSDTANLTPADGVLEYNLQTPLWSDGAAKKRWLAVPGLSKITFDATNAWSFPYGTALVKHFDIETSDHGTRRLETRVLLHELSGWAGYTYRWNNIDTADSQTDATLLTTSSSVTVNVNGAPFVWTFPSRNDCLRCHTEVGGRVLGVHTRQMNRSFAYPLAEDNQLRTLNHIGMFLNDIGDTSQYESFAPISNTNASLSRRVASYLASNCSHCHQPYGGTPVSIDLRYDPTFLYPSVIGALPEAEDLGLPNAHIITPGSPSSSILFERMNRTDVYRMPALGSHVVDTDALDVVQSWILSLP